MPMRKWLRSIGIFCLIAVPLIALSFLAYTVFHQTILLLGTVIAVWVACYVSRIMTENERLNREVFLQAYELKKSKDALESCLASEAQAPAYRARYLESKLTEECNRSKRYSRPLSCLLLAFDSLPEGTGSRGNFFLDAAVQEVARFIKESIRSVDSLIRYGNDRLVMILPETQIHQARVVANRIRFGVEKKTFTVERESLKLTPSIGAVSFDPSVHRGKEDLLAALEQSLQAVQGARLTRPETGLNPPSS